MDETKKILSVHNLRVSFKTDYGIVHAVRGVSFDLYKGETLCIVGESGSGKSVTSKTIRGILPPSARIEEGSVEFEGEDLTKVSEEEFHNIRGKKIGMIFQDPLSSLNPIRKVGKQITEARLINRNRLTRLYESKIQKERIALKNAQSKKNTEKGKTYAEEDFFLSDSKKKLDDLLYSHPDWTKQEKKQAVKEAKQKQKEGYKIIRAEGKAKRKEIDKEYKSCYPSLKKELDQKKKIAKKEVALYYKELKNEKKEKLASLKQKLLQSNNSEEAKKDYEVKKKQIEDEFISKTKITKARAKEKALAVRKEVGIPQPELRFKQYPFEFSGGRRQRIVIAIALTANPDILICDEPTTALDVTIQAQILELINKLKKARNRSIIFITHDLGVVANRADRVAVRYAGKIVEVGTVYEIFFQPKHPYTWALLSSIPDIDSKEKLEAIPGTPPNLINPPKGDAFAQRNKYALKIDYEYEPPEFSLSPTHKASTWLLYEKFAPKVTRPSIIEKRIERALEEEKEYEQKNKEEGKPSA